MTEEELNAAMAKWGTRESAVEFPHSMNVTAYLMKELGIPKHWHGNDLVYHYTDAAGLRGILTERVFWATKSPFLNDPTEVVYSVDVVSQLLRDRAQGSGPEAEIASAVLNSVSAPDSDLYVTSFCRDGDLLSQWRGYGAFGSGFALGFDFGKPPPIQMAWLIEVLYDRKPLEDAVDQILGIFSDFLAAKASSKWVMEEVVDFFPETLHVLWLAFKHPAYREEHEVRLLAHRSSKAEYRQKDAVSFGKVHYRASGADIVPYLEVGMSFPDDEPVPHLPLRQIIVGPGVRFDRNQEALQQMLSDLGYEDVEVVPSKVPFSP